MRLLKNSGTDRVLDILRSKIIPEATLDIATQDISLFALQELYEQINNCKFSRYILPGSKSFGSRWLGDESDRIFRNKLLARTLARKAFDLFRGSVEVRAANTDLPQSLIIVASTKSSSIALSGSCPLSTSGLGVTPSNRFGMIQVTETEEETDMFHSWYESLWKETSQNRSIQEDILRQLQSLIEHRSPQSVYFLSLSSLFSKQAHELDEEKIVKSATGIKNSLIWQKLFKFQRDGVVGAIDKLERFGGCILADSVGLGKTFEALAVIKYYELRNDRVLVLAPKRLRDNWTVYRANDDRNILASDKLNYDVLNHTDLSRDTGLSGDIDLSHINWGNYDLVVIDESHNFRNKNAPRAGSETRYDRLMRKVIREGVKTRVLMLSATPVNNRLTDLKNQIAFATEGKDDALFDYGIPNISNTVRLAQRQFNLWLRMPEEERRPARLIEMLGFDYFHLLDQLTIARSRKHIEKYYGTSETGKFPERLKPINIKSYVDENGEFPPISEINDEIRKLNLATYAPLRYVLPSKQEAYDKKYSQVVKDGTGLFRQADREESLIHLLRVNLLKRMESAVSSFTLTIERQLKSVEEVLTKLESLDGSIEEIDIQTLDVEDPALEPLLVGEKVKVLLHDVDRIKWKQDLLEDKERLTNLLKAAKNVDFPRDAKLRKLREVIKSKIENPINDDNKKIIIFTAFSDTAAYLYEYISDWAHRELNVATACVTGSGRNLTTLRNLRTDMASILSAFSPRSKERPKEYAEEGEIDLLIATDCISEGQNLQDCDYLINYDIHWNPVRIIQRFGRVDRIGSKNKAIQLVNFWPNMELEEYINLELRVSGRMVLLDVSATGEENLIEQQSGNPMNDLEYRRKQLLKLQETVIDLEDLSSGISITDLTLNDFRIDFTQLTKDERKQISELPFGTFAVVEQDESTVPGAIFCLRAVSEAQEAPLEPGYPLAPHYLVYVADDGSILYPFTQAKPALDILKRLCAGLTNPSTKATQSFDRLTKNGERMEHYQKLLSSAVSSIVGKNEEKSTASLFKPGGTHSKKGEFFGMNDFEVIMYLAIVPKSN